MNLIIIILVALLIIFNLSTRTLESYKNFSGCGAGCGDPNRFPTYRQECWSFLDANPPPDPYHFYYDYGPLCENKPTSNDHDRWRRSSNF